MSLRRPDWWYYPEQCQNGHEWGPGRVLVSWERCNCAGAQTAHPEDHSWGHTTVECGEPGCRWKCGRRGTSRAARDFREWRAPAARGACKGDLMAESFNADFYRTCAIVIPALFVSLAVQAQSYESELRRGERMPLPRRWLILNVAYLYVVFGGIGELVALLALFERSDALVWRVTVLIATLLLLSAVITGPFYGYLRTVRHVVRRSGPGEGKVSGG